MPSSRRPSRSRSRSKKPRSSWRTKLTAASSSADPVANRALAMAMLALKQSKEETKYNDVITGVLTADYTGAVVSLNAIAQGLTNTTRVGNIIEVQFLKFRMIMRTNLTTQAAGQMVRVVIFQDLKNTSGTNPTSAEYFSSVGAGDTAILTMTNRIGVEANRFKTYFDRVFCFNDVASNATPSVIGGGAMFYEQYIDLHRTPKKVSFNGAASTDEYVGSFFMLYCSDVNVNDPTINFSSRIGFKDG